MRFQLDETIRIKRLKTSSGNKRRYVATATADASVQPFDKEASQVGDGVFGESYVAYVDATVPVQNSDRIIDSDGVKYTVKDVAIRDFGAFPHKRILMQRKP